ncbi:MAG: hypothetical protein WCQ72_05320 [Eubacteriales bacterium]
MDKLRSIIPKDKNKRRTLFLTGGLCLVVLIFAVIGSVWLKYFIISHNIDAKQPIYDENRIYYSALSAKEQALYDEIHESAAAVERSTALLPYIYGEDEFNAVMNAVKAENPEFFFIRYENCKLTETGSKSLVNIAYCTLPDEIAAMRAALDERVSAVLSELDLEIGLSAGEFDREVWLHDYILKNTDGVTSDITQADIPLYATAYGALILGHADSNGYSSAFSLLLGNCGIYSSLVYGSADSGGVMEHHVWNLVRVDGSYYHTDITWDDANIDYAPDIMFHGYFNLSYAMISRDHVADDAAPLPPCDTENTFYNVNGLYIKDKTSLTQTADLCISAAAESGRSYFELYPSYTRDNTELYNDIIARVKAFNEVNGGILRNEIRIYNASASSNAVTVEIFRKD